MTRAKDISKILTDADLSGTLDVAGAVTAGGLTVDGTASTSITSTNGNILNLYRSGTGSDSVAINFYDGSNDRSQIKSADGGLSFHINGTTRAVDIDSSGRVGIGTTSPNEKLTVSSGAISFLGDISTPSIGAGLFRPANNTLAVVTGSTERMRIDSSGNVGIGTSSPSDILHIKDASSTNVLIDAPTDNASLTLQCGSSDAGAEGAFVNFIQNTTSKWQMGMNTDNSFRWYNYNTSSEAMQIDSSGNVGIGTSSPTAKLDLVDDNVQLRLANSTTGTTTSDGSRFQLSGNDLLLINRESANIQLYTADTERMRIDSSGNLLVGTTTNGTTADGTVIRASAEVLMTRTNGQPLLLNRAGNDGTLIEFRQANSVVGYIGANSSGIYIATTDGSDAGLGFRSNQLVPCTTTGANRDNIIDLGASGSRFDDIFATNGTIQTSDRNEKQDIEELSEAEQRVAVVAKGLMRKFRWIDSVAEKGDNARTHFGIIAQDLQDAFAAEGLDASDYAMFTSNTWWEKEISVDAVEADEENGIEAQDAYTYKKIAEEATEGYTERTRLGVRYNQLLAFIISAI